jgi:hypothetical protein
MQNEPSSDPRDQAIRAALRDIAVLASIVAGEFYATYGGAERAEYLRVLGSYIEDLGGRLEGDPGDLVATFEGRPIAIRFGPLVGGR